MRSRWCCDRAGFGPPVLGGPSEGAAPRGALAEGGSAATLSSQPGPSSSGREAARRAAFAYMATGASRPTKR
eukprot:11218032-Lingulodinium_polyedra.AAC.1